MGPLDGISEFLLLLLIGLWDHLGVGADFLGAASSGRGAPVGIHEAGRISTAGCLAPRLRCRPRRLWLPDLAVVTGL